MTRAEVEAMMTRPRPINMNWGKLLPLIAILVGFAIQTFLGVWWLSKADSRITANSQTSQQALRLSQTNSEILSTIKSDIASINTSLKVLVEADGRAQTELVYRRGWMDQVNEDIPSIKTRLNEMDSRLTRIESSRE